MHFLKTTVAALGAAVLLAAPAGAGAAPTPPPPPCAPSGSLSYPFAPFGDNGLYSPVVNEGLEDGSTGWTLTGGATVVNANEPWFISGRTSDSHALSLPSGATATTTPFCVDETYTHIRLFTRNTGLLTSSQLKVEIMTYQKGKWVAGKGFTQRDETGNWVLSESVPIQVLEAGSGETTHVAFRFSAVGLKASVQIDDVYVDPWSRA
jgi:hypothetical protein